MLAALPAAAPRHAKEEPVGLVLTAAGSKVLRASSETPLAARAGRHPFLRRRTPHRIPDAASFLYCPGKTSQTLDQGGDLLFDAKQLKVKTGKLSASKPVNSCFLPQLVRVNVASQQHYGVSMTRGLTKPEGDVLPIAALAANVRAEIDPFEAHSARIRTTPPLW